MRNKFLRTMSFIIGLLAFAKIFAASYDLEANGIYYKKSSDKLIVVAGTDKYSGDIIIPEEVSVNSSTILPVVEISSNAFKDCTDLKSVKIGNNVQKIGDYAFSGCTRLMTIELGNSMQEIGNRAFNSCMSIVELEFPGSLKKILQYAFSDCTSLKSVYFNEGEGKVEFSKISVVVGQDCIGTYVYNIYAHYAGCQFSGCNSLKDVYLGKEINYENNKKQYSSTPNPVLGFENCSSITSITIGENITSVSCFKGCENITSVVSKIKDPTQCPIITLGQNSYDNAILTVPQGTSDVYSQTGEWSKFANIVEQKNLFSLSISCNVGGSISFGEDTIKNETQCYDIPENELIQLSITPDMGYIIESITVNGEDYTTNISDGTLTLGMLTNNTDVIVCFAPYVDEGKHELIITVNGHGQVIYEENIVTAETASFRVENDASVTLRILPAIGYRTALALLNNVDITDMLVDGTYTIRRMRADMVFEVEFEVAPATLTISMADRGSVTMDALSGSTYEFTITPAIDWSIHTVTFDGEDITALLGTDGRLTTPVVTGDAVLNISFEYNSTTSQAQYITGTNIRVWAQGTTLHFDGVPQGEIVEVFTADGMRVRSFSDGSHQTELPKGEVYIIRCNEKIVKISL